MIGARRRARLLFGGGRVALLAVLGFASLGVLGLWDASMATLGMILAAVLIALADRGSARDPGRPEQPRVRPSSRRSST